MEKQLDISNAVKLLHTEFVERDSLICDIQRWPLITNLKELPPYYLIALQIKRTQG